MEKVKKVLSEISIDQMMDRVRYLTEHFPYRLSGSEDERQAAQYVCDTMRSYGMEIENIQFDTYNSTPMRSRVEILAPEHFIVDSLPCAHIKATPEDGKELEIVYVASGSFNDYKGLDVKGKMVLVEVSYTPPVPEKAHIAMEMGAAGIMCMNWGNDEEVICHRGLKSVWGNPTPESFHSIPDLIGVGVTRNAGLKIRDLCLSGQKVIAKITAIADRRWSQVNEPHGIIHGNGNSDEFILIASHLDAWKPGVTCNATGNATTLEICRVLSQHCDELERDIHVVFWNGHEVAEAAGSTYFLDHHWDLLNKKCIAYMHIDSTGLLYANKLEIKISDELSRFARRNVAAIEDKDLRMMPLHKIGDQSFMGIGIPSVCQRVSYTEEYLAKTHGATIGWWNHTKEDGVDKCDPDVLYQDTVIHTEFIYNLVNSKILPYDFAPKFERIENNLLPLVEKYGKYVDFSDLLANVREAKALVLDVQGRRDRIREDQIAEFNDFLKIISRHLTNIFQTYSSKFDQDRYGHTNLSAPIPLLAEITKLSALDERSLEYGMIETMIVRNKNRITDGLKTIIDFAKLYQKVIV